MSDDRIRRSLERRAQDVEPSDDLRRRVIDREPGRETGPSMARRVAIGVFALAISAAAFALIIPSGGPPPAPTASSPPAPASSFESVEVEPGIGRLTAAFGSIWVVGTEGVIRVDQETGEVLTEIPVPGITPAGTELPFSRYGGVPNGSGITSGGGFVWVTAEPDIVAIDPTTDRVVERITVESSITNIVFSRGRLVVGGMAEGSGHLLLVPQNDDPRTWSSRPGGGGAFPLVAATEHFYWTGGRATSGSALSRTSLDLGVQQEIRGVDAVHAFADAGGYLWVMGDDVLYQVDAQPSPPEAPRFGSVDAVITTIPIPGPGTIAGDGDHLWLLVEAGDVCELTELDPETGERLGDPIEVHLPLPAEMTVVDGVPWVSYRANPVLRRGVLIRPTAG